MTLAVLMSLGIFCAVMYTSSCTKDACKGVTCLHKGICSGSSCTCIDSGLGGQNCEIIYRDLYKNNYGGNAVVSYGSLDSPVIDTGYVNYTAIDNKLKFTVLSDTDYSHLQLVWENRGVQMLQTIVKLTNNSATGSTFEVLSTQGTPGWNNYTFRGSGNINGTNASVHLVASSSDTTKPSMSFTLSDFTRQ